MKKIEVTKGTTVGINLDDMPEGVTVYVLTATRLGEIIIVSGVVGAIMAVFVGLLTYTLIT